MMKLLAHFLILVAFFCTKSIAQQSDVGDSDAFQLMHLVVEPGQRVSGELPIGAGADGVETFIPVTVFQGAKEGPVLSLIAGIHGSEYSPILSMQRLPSLLDPAQMSGTLIIVHIANMPAFQGRTIYFSPNDLKNLNRSFPGNLDGTVTERIAYTLTKEIIARSDYLVDIHSGDGNESLRPSYSAYYREAGGEEVVRESRRIAVAFGLETVVEFAGSYDSVEDAIYTSAQAVTRGIPAMDVESGELGIVNDVYIDPITQGAVNLLKELDMIPGQAEKPNNPLFVSSRARTYSEHQGIWHADELVQTGDYVTEGTRLGVITDYFGNELQTIYAPGSGVLLILFGTPPVNEGDNIVVIGEIAEGAN
ncbi:MAG: succinylglutamate desuccinylase/aspartoacylase family protein [Pseudohongiellaceae bacterium]